MLEIGLCGCMKSWTHQSSANQHGSALMRDGERDTKQGTDKPAAPASRYSSSETSIAPASTSSEKTSAATKPDASTAAEKLAQAAALVEGLESSGSLDPETTKQLKDEIRKLAPGSKVSPASKNAGSTSDEPTATLDDPAPRKPEVILREARESKPRPAKVVAHEDSTSVIVEVSDQPDTTAVRPAMHQEPAERAASWEDDLSASIARLELETQDPPTSPSGVNRHAALRMLYLLAGRRNDALKPIPGIAPLQQDFWREEFYGLATLMDADHNPDTPRRAAEGTQHLRMATTKLAEASNLTLRNMALCSEVNGYGNHRPFTKYRFKPGQSILAYVEVENFRTEPRDDQFRIAVKGSYQIKDKSGERIDARDYPLSEDTCQNARRDLYLMYPVDLPTRLPTGIYTLELSVEDTLSQKLGQSSLEFTAESN
jgi:hypothetical protein